MAYYSEDLGLIILGRINSGFFTSVIKSRYFPSSITRNLLQFRYRGKISPEEALNVNVVKSVILHPLPAILVFWAPCNQPSNVSRSGISLLLRPDIAGGRRHGGSARCEGCAPWPFDWQPWQPERTTSGLYSPPCPAAVWSAILDFFNILSSRSVRPTQKALE